MTSKDSAQTPKRQFRVSKRVWIGLFIAVLALAFIFQNREVAVITLLFFQVKAAQWITLLTLFLVGLGTGWLIFRPQR